MKKLLLSLLILVATVLPGMAQNCDQKWHWAKENITVLVEELIDQGDLECLEYYVDVEGLNLNDVKMLKDENLILLAFNRSVARPEILSFFINHGISLKDIDMDRIVFNMQFIYEDECDLFFKKFQILLNEYPDAWKRISDSNVKNIVIDVAIANDPVRATKLLLDNKLPVSEYNRYIKAAEKWIKELEKDRNKPNIRNIFYLEDTKWIEAAEKLIALLEERKNVELQSMNENLKRVLNKINEEKWNKIEEETQNRYDYQF